MKNAIKAALILMVVASAGCKSVNKLIGNDNGGEPTEQSHEFYVVSCCTDSGGSYPAAVPAQHVDLCQRAQVACKTNDCQIEGDTYLPMSVDCGRTPYKIGDQYYPATGF
jgi:hypothetical protein